MQVKHNSKRIYKRFLQLFFSGLALMNSVPSTQANIASSDIQLRIDDVRQRLFALDQLEDTSALGNTNRYLAQWYNWPNWPNWGNWGNWPNYWMNY